MTLLCLSSAAAGQQPLPTPVGWWSWRGTCQRRIVRDLSGRRLDAIGHGLTCSRTPHADAARFDGSTAWVDLPDSASLRPTTGFTITAWVRVPDPARDGTIVGRAAPPDSLRLYVGSGSAQFRLDVPRNDEPHVWLSAPIQPGEWTQIAGVFDGQTAALYVDDRLEASAVARGPALEAFSPLQIGNGPNGFFEGEVEEVRVFDVALSGAQVRALAYRAPQGVPVGDVPTYEKPVIRVPPPAPDLRGVPARVEPKLPVISWLDSFSPDQPRLGFEVLRDGATVCFHRGKNGLKEETFAATRLPRAKLEPLLRATRAADLCTRQTGPKAGAADEQLVLALPGQECAVRQCFPLGDECEERARVLAALRTAACPP
jgi:hypothetical protein